MFFVPISEVLRLMDAFHELLVLFVHAFAVVVVWLMLRAMGSRSKVITMASDSITTGRSGKWP